MPRHSSLSLYLRVADGYYIMNTAAHKNRVISCRHPLRITAIDVVSNRTLIKVQMFDFCNSSCHHKTRYCHHLKLITMFGAVKFAASLCLHCVIFSSKTTCLINLKFVHIVWFGWWHYDTCIAGTSWHSWFLSWSNRVVKVVYIERERSVYTHIIQ